MGYRKSIAMWVKVSILLIASIFGLATMSSVRAQNLPSSDEFDRELRACNSSEHINIDDSILGSLASLYSNDSARQALKSPTDFLLLIPENKRIDAYRLYAQCIAKIVPQLASVTPAPSTPITTTYRICSGEYERACQQHDVYMYCYENPENWAKDRCTTYSVRQLNSYGGNKCGYNLYEVLCTGPK
jgi:hypothetical protein